ncbi:MAG: hypothetical protein HN368_07630 [Spirochaetales bacterium]|jgi:hypothetical protein|nr:hypothetical protein [Spirochaetales bacterium]
MTGKADSAAISVAVPRLVLGAVALVSGSVLTLEISLTRFYSILFVHHFTYLVLSVAVFGLAAGGIFVKLRSDHKKTDSAPAPMWMLPAIASGAVLIMTATLTWIPPLQRVAIAAVLSIVPFFFTGAFLAAIFQAYPENSRRLYGFDLIGAAVGSLSTLLLLRLGTLNVQIFVALALSVAALSIYPRTASKRKNIAIVGYATALAVLLVANSASSFLGRVPFAEVADKQLTTLLQNETLGAEIRESRWSAFGRTDFVASSDVYGIGIFYIDGTSGTRMYQFDGDFYSLMNTDFSLFPAHLPLALAARKRLDSVLTIGPGGGRDVLAALMHGAIDITAVEVNRDLVSMMREYADVNGGIYNGIPWVDVKTVEGRNYVKTIGDQEFDSILLAMPVIQSSRSIEGFALTENYLLTTEAMDEYYDLLAPDGQLIIVGHNVLEVYRVVSTAIEILENRGLSSDLAMKQIYTFGPESMPTVVLRKNPITENEAAYLVESIRQSNWDSSVVFVPFVHHVSTPGSLPSLPTMNRSLYAISESGASFEDSFADFAADFRPVTDDRPFFYQFEKRIPQSVTTVLILAVALIICSLIVGRRRRSPGLRRIERTAVVVFMITGTGFMLFEVAIIQKLILYLGQPVLSLALVLTFLVLGLGVGSLASAKVFGAPTWKTIQWSLAATAILSVLYGLLLFQLPAVMIQSVYAVRVSVIAVAMFLYGLVAGVPFPTTMSLLKSSGLGHEVPRMWSVNAAASVFGSALAIAVGISAGFTYALLAAAALYGAGAVVVISQLSSIHSRDMSPESTSH